jgi:hypothetical protein
MPKGLFHSHSIVSGTYKHLKIRDFLESDAKLSVTCTAKILRLGAIDGESLAHVLRRERPSCTSNVVRARLRNGGVRQGTETGRGKRRGLRCDNPRSHKSIRVRQSGEICSCGSSPRARLITILFGFPARNTDRHAVQSQPGLGLFRRLRLG